MKKNKIMISIIILFIVELSFFNYNTYFDYKITSNTTPVSIKSTKDVDKKILKKELIKDSEKANVGIVVKEDVHKTNKNIRQYYATNNLLKGNFSLSLSNDEYLSNEKSNDAKQKDILKVPNLFNNYKIYSFNNIDENKVLDYEYLLFGDYNQLMEYKRYLEEDNIQAESVIKFNAKTNYNLKRFFYLLCMLIFLIMLYASNSQKEYMIYRLNGYSFRKMLYLEFKKIIKVLFKIELIAYVILTALTLLYNYRIVLGYLYYFSKYMLIVNIIIILIYMIIIAIYSKNVNIKNIKNKNKNFLILWMSIVLKLIILIVIIFNIVTIIPNLNKSIELCKNINYSSKTINNYVGLNHNRLGIARNDDIEKQFNKASNDFYKLTNQKNNGVLVNSNNYESISNEKNTCQTYNECSITINENYLNINPVNFTKGSIDKSKNNVLIPNNTKNINKKIDEVVTHYKYDINKNDINVILYDKNTKFYLFNQYSPMYLKDIPVILLKEGSQVEKYVIENAIGSYYFIRDGSKKEDTEIKEALQKTKLEKFVHSTPKKTEKLQVEKQRVAHEMKNQMSIIIVHLLFYYIVIKFSLSVYIDINLKNNIIKKLHGYSNIKIIKEYVYIIIFQYAIIFIFLNIYERVVLLLLLFSDMVIIFIKMNKILSVKATELKGDL